MHGLKRWYGGDMAAFPDSGWRPRHLHTPHFVMHADDDSYIRIDHLLARMVRGVTYRHTHTRNRLYCLCLDKPPCCDM